MWYNTTATQKPCGKNVTLLNVEVNERKENMTHYTSVEKITSPLQVGDTIVNEGTTHTVSAIGECDCGESIPTELFRLPCEVWTRVMGYHRPTASFNVGKQGEFAERVPFKENCC
jgi:anaerobic ribonucleoside-triphosphate reductase